MWLNTSGCHPNSALKMKTIKRIEISLSALGPNKELSTGWLTNKGGYRLLRLMFWFIPPSDGSCEHSWHCRFEPVQYNVQYSVQYSVQDWDWGGRIIFSELSTETNCNITSYMEPRLIVDCIWLKHIPAPYFVLWQNMMNGASGNVLTCTFLWRRYQHSHNLSAARGPVCGNHKGIQKV